MENFVEVVEDLMLAKEISASTLAREAHIPKSAISMYLSGASYPTVKNLLKLAQFFDVNIDYLLGRVSKNDGFKNLQSSDFLTRINALIAENNLSINKFHNELNLSNNAYYHWSDGSLPYVPQIISICEYFGVSADYLLGLTNKR